MYSDYNLVRGTDKMLCCDLVLGLACLNSTSELPHPEAELASSLVKASRISSSFDLMRLWGTGGSKLPYWSAGFINNSPAASESVLTILSDGKQHNTLDYVQTYSNLENNGLLIGKDRGTGA